MRWCRSAFVLILMTLLIGLGMMPISVGQPSGGRPGLVRGSTWMLRNSLSAGGASAIRVRAARFQMLTTRSRRAVAVLAVVLATAVGGCTGGSEQGTSAAPASSSAATATGTVDDRAARSDQLLASLLAADQPGCSAAVAIDGQVVWEGARGLANLEQKDTADHGHPVRHRLGVQAVHRHRDPVAVLRRRPHPCRTRCPSTCQGCPRGRIRSPWTS